MFSEYASKFLAQSQSRISFASPQDQHSRTSRQDTKTPLSQRGPQRRPRRGGIVGLGQLGFNSKAPFQAPLLHGRFGDTGTGYEEEYEEEEEHEREVADYFALQRSRKHFVHGHLEGSSEIEAETVQDPTPSLAGRSKRGHGQDVIKSSWLGERSSGSSHGCVCLESRHSLSPVANIENLADNLSSVNLDVTESGSGSTSSRIWPTKATSSNTNKWSTDESEPLAGFFGNSDNPPAQESDISEMPNRIQMPGTEAFYHDRFWAQVYFIVTTTFFTSFVLVWLHVSLPSNHSLGDTVYNTIRESYYILVIDTIVAVIVSLFWLALLRFYARSLVYAILLGVPTALVAFSIYPFICSFKTADRSTTYQDKIMRWLSLAPLIFGGAWLYGVYNSRQSFKRAIGLLELAVKILAAYPPLIFVGFGTLAAVVSWSWLWIIIFTRVFLGGHFTPNLLFVIDFGTWWLGIFYVLVYLWTLNIISGVQRATAAASVSQWYFHRLNVPIVAAEAVVRAALSHALTTCFGTICLSTLLALMARLPILILPKRVVVIAGIFSATFVSDNVNILTHPTTLTHAAIHSQHLAEAARVVAQFSFVAKKSRHGRRVTGVSPESTNQPHRLALLLLYATRLAASFGFGFGAWIHAARTVTTGASKIPYKGSLYAYIVGLIAGAIGWTVIGAIEGVLTSIVDGVVVCWESEISTGSRAHYCREADMVLGSTDDDFSQEDGDTGRLLRV